jgi:hypothetical protein
MRWDEETTLFVYGSLIEEARRIELLGRSVATAPAVLHGYAVGRTRYFYIRPQPDTVTTGMLLLDLSVHDFRELDRYEEIPVLYVRDKIVVVDAAGQLQRCWVYLPTPRTLSDHE